MFRWKRDIARSRTSSDGGTRGFATPTGKAEIYSERFLEHGYPPLPEYEEPLVSQVSRPDLADALSAGAHLRAQYALSVKPSTAASRACASFRAIRKSSCIRTAAADAGHRAGRLGEDRDSAWIGAGAGAVQRDVWIRAWWSGSMAGGRRARRLGAPGYDPFSEDGANLNLIVGNAAIDPVSGSVPHRSYVCEIRALG